MTRARRAFLLATLAAAPLASLAAQAKRWSTDFGYNSGAWRLERHVRLIGDVSGDGRADIVGCGETGVTLALSTGSSFRSSTFAQAFFGYAQGWDPDKHPRVLADVDGDGRADLVGFGKTSVEVARSLGTSFQAPGAWVVGFGYNQGWLADQPRTMADVDGDGRADVVGFGANAVEVSLSRGNSFLPPFVGIPRYGTNSGGWRIDRHPRFLADVDGDGADDIVAFGNGGVEVARSLKNAFGVPKIWVTGYGYNDGWRVDRHPRFVADVDGDGRADVVGFGNAGVWVSLSTGSSFTAAKLWVDNFGYASAAGAWRVEHHPRLLADVDGDGKLDVVGFGNHGAYVSFGSATAFLRPLPWAGELGAADGWLVARHPRGAADADGDGREDLIGFFDDGVHVHNGWLHSISKYGTTCPADLDASLAVSGWSTRTVGYVATNTSSLVGRLFLVSPTSVDVPLPGGCRLLAAPDFVLLPESSTSTTASMTLVLPASIRIPFYTQFVGVRSQANGLVLTTSRRIAVRF